MAVVLRGVGGSWVEWSAGDICGGVEFSLAVGGMLCGVAAVGVCKAFHSRHELPTAGFPDVTLPSESRG